MKLRGACLLLALVCAFASPPTRADEGPARPQTNQGGNSGSTGQNQGGSPVTGDDDLLDPLGLGNQPVTGQQAGQPATGQQNGQAGTGQQTGVAPGTNTGRDPRLPVGQTTGPVGTDAQGSGRALDPAARGAQGTTQQQARTGGEDADLLDPLGRTSVDGAGERPLDEVAPPDVTPVPPISDADKERIDRAVQQQVGGRAEDAGRTLERIADLERTDPDAARRALEEELARSERDLDAARREFESVAGASGEIERVARTIEDPTGTDLQRGGQPDAGVGRTDGPGTGGARDLGRTDGPGLGDATDLTRGQPIGPVTGPGAGDFGGPTDLARTGGAPAGEEDMSWWQKLLLKAFEGVSDGLKKLAENRANELKLRSDTLAMAENPANRPYADAATRASIEASAFGRAGVAPVVADPRLNDLILGNSRAPLASGQAGGGTIGSSPRINVPGMSTRSAGNQVRVTRLPRVTDPITGEERIVIDMPLGADAVRPLR